MSAAVEGRTLEQLSVGAHVERAFTVGDADIRAFAAVSHDHNPVHLDDDYAAGTAFKERIAHGMLSAGYISAVLGKDLPGPGAVYLSQTLRFKRPVRIGAVVVVKVTVESIVERTGKVTLSTVCLVDGKVVLEGEAEVLVPRVPRAVAGAA